MDCSRATMPVVAVGLATAVAVMRQSSSKSNVPRSIKLCGAVSYTGIVCRRVLVFYISLMFIEIPLNLNIIS